MKVPEWDGCHLGRKYGVMLGSRDVIIYNVIFVGSDILYFLMVKDQ